VLVEQDAREVAGVTRGQNAVYVMPHDWASIAQFLGPMLERVDESSREVQLLVVTSDAETAAAVAAAAVKLTTGRDIGIVAATAAKRAARLLRIKPAQVVAGAPDALVDLLKTATIKLETVRAVCIAWADELIAQGSTPALETLMAEAPKESGRTIVTAELSPAIEELLERYARRARRVTTPSSETDAPVSVEYVTVSSHSRLATLRRVLDVADPQSALVFVREGESGVDVRELLRALGYAGEESAVRAGLTAPPGTDVVVLFDLPASREELREAAGASKRTIALIQPRQLASLRALTAGGAVKPLTLPESGASARGRDARIRDELRASLASGQFGRELLALEPLLDEYDGIEIAAATLQLLERERAERAATPATATPSAAKAREPGTMVRLFVNAGSRDGVRPADIVGTIASQPGVTSGDVGKVEVRESHTVVEVSASVADLVIEKVTGSTIRGRRAVARRDEGPPRDAGRGARDAARGGRDSGRGTRDATGGRERSPRGGPRDSARDARPPRPTSRAPRPNSRTKDRD
jgi:ATP-dependent RNA helicase DeaD